MTFLADRGKAVWLGVGAAAVAVLAGLAGPDRPAPVGAASPGAPATVVAQASPVTSRLSVIGAIEPGRSVNVIAPFAGTVKEKRFEHGQSVERGRTLLVMDGAELEMRLRDAETALLKAAQRVEELKHWSGGAEVSRARRQVAGAERDAEQAQRRVREAKPLIDRGIIPRQEYEDLLRQAEAQGSTLAAAREDLAAALRQGGADAGRMAELELANAEARRDELKGQRDRAAVVAPVAGLVLKAPSTGGVGSAGPAAVETGSAVANSQILLTVADLETLAVSARVDEMDVNRIRPGQPVEVGGDAFPDGPVRGRIAWVAHQATAGEGASTAASFAIRVELPDLTEEQRRHVRIGMSASLSVILYESASSIVLPPDAVLRMPSGPVVRVRDPATGAERIVPVTVGEPTPTGLEIRAGLQPGDAVVVGPLSVGSVP